MNLWPILAAVTLGLAVLWIALVVTLYLVGRRTDDRTRLRDALRLVPDVVRLLRRLAADHSLPRGVLLRLAALVVYLVLPIDLIPDFIPVVGYADDAIIVAIALRSVTRAAGPDAIDGTGRALRRAWPRSSGSPAWRPNQPV